MPRHSRDMLKLLLWTLRDMADQDYVNARMAWRARLYPSYFWSASQALEKYLKCISALNGLLKLKGARHQLFPLLEHLIQNLPFTLDVAKATKNFIRKLDDCAPYRYGQTSWDTLGLSIYELDYAVWDVRRYVQPLVDAYPTGGLQEKKDWESRAWETMADKADTIARAGSMPVQPFCIAGGWIEQVVSDKKHPARSALVWNNPGFGVRKRKTVRVYPDWSARNSPLSWFPNLVEEYYRYVHLEPEVLAGYRELAAANDSSCA